MAVTDRIEPLVRPLLDDLGVELFDLEHEGGVLRVTVEREGGVDMEAIAELTRRISRALDEHDPVPGRYTLEVSSPGLERTLRTPAHHRWALGKVVRIKTVPGTEGDRRVEGTLAEADDEGVTVALGEGPDAPTRRLAYDEIERSRTVFEWGPAPKPGGKQPKGTKPSSKGAAAKGGAGTPKAKGAPRSAKPAKGRGKAPKGARPRGPSDELDEPIPGRSEGHDKEAKVESS